MARMSIFASGRASPDAAPPKFHARLFGLVLAVAIVAGFAGVARAQSIYDLLIGRPLPDTRDVRFGETIYRIPVAKYRIWSKPYATANDPPTFGFSLILPDLAPVTSDPAEVATWGKGTGWHRELHVLVQYWRDYITQQKMLENAFNDSKRMKALQDEYEKQGKKVVRSRYLDKDVYTELPDGCRRYEGYAIGGNVVQVCGEGQSLLVTKCVTDVPSPGCHVAITYADKTQLTYSYGYDYADQGLAIHRKLIALLDSFRVAPTK